ncbi:hypothetical protein [Enterococcus asini]|uniref:hypothetical protein n=1 Tax=Enterococcus asini TaxID=57732 RepID=UPI00266DD59D|nr:hypothetical protein [Enterococcus asini]
MKKVSILLFSVLALSACSQSKTDSSSSDKSSETTATSTTVVQSSSSQQMSVAQSSSSQQTSSDTQEDSVSYAVNLDDFTQELTMRDGSKQTIHHLKFESKQKNQPTAIVLNTKDLNNTGNGLYITTTEGDELFYPVSIAEEPTKTITVTNDAGKKRQVKVNTVVKVATPEDSSDPMQIVGDTYFLFYNNQGTISLATRNFAENAVGTALDTTNLVEYLQEGSTTETPTTPAESNESEVDSDTYYDSILAAWQRQHDYIVSIEDDAVKQSVQTSHSAAIFEANRLQMEHPEDAAIINESLHKVLEGK